MFHYLTPAHVVERGLNIKATVSTAKDEYCSYCRGSIPQEYRLYEVTPVGQEKEIEEREAFCSLDCLNIAHDLNIVWVGSTLFADLTDDECEADE